MAAMGGVTDKQQGIVDAARRIISTRGIESLTIREIAKEVKVTEGALYRHFKSKAEIISLLIDDVERTLLSTVQLASEKDADPLSRLQSILFSHISYAEQRKGFTFLLINEALSLKEVKLQKKMYAVIEQYLRKIRAVLIDGIDKKIFRKDMDVGLASLAFFGLVQSFVTFWALSAFEFSITKNKIKALFAVYKEGIVQK